MKWLKFLLLAIGFVALWMIIQSVGIKLIVSNISHLGWWFLPILSIYAVVYFFNTLGWFYSFPKNLPTHVPLKNLYALRVIGETLNAVLPFTASVGGEPVKAQVLKSKYGISLSEGYASSLIIHITLCVSLNLFAIGALLIALQNIQLPSLLWEGLAIFLLTLIAGGILLFLGLYFGIFSQLYRIGDFFKVWGERSEEKKLKYLDLDTHIRKFFTHDKRNFFLSSFFNLLGWLSGAVEVYFIAQVMGLPLTWQEAWLLEASIQILRMVTFLIPSSIGAQDGGIVLLFLQMGFENTVGVTFAVVRRLREIIWIGIGLLLWAILKDEKKA